MILFVTILNNKVKRLILFVTGDYLSLNQKTMEHIIHYHEEFDTQQAADTALQSAMSELDIQEDADGDLYVDIEGNIYRVVGLSYTLTQLAKYVVSIILFFHLGIVLP